MAVNPTEGITYSEATLRSLMAARSSPGGFVVATVTNPGSFMATITHPTGNGYCRDRILRDTPPFLSDHNMADFDRAPWYVLFNCLPLVS